MDLNYTISRYYDKYILKRMNLPLLHCIICKKGFFEEHASENHPFCTDNLQYLEWAYEEFNKNVKNL